MLPVLSFFLAFDPCRLEGNDARGKARVCALHARPLSGPIWMASEHGRRRCHIRRDAQKVHYCLHCRVKYNLNELSYDTVFEMIRCVKEHVKLIDHVASRERSL